ncbi:hypothetical protein RUMHYD_02881 [Blautia hydrogenotrophica DSM 10507]|uniref:Uncharacterized protein n=1 Tax=Blautia hydrogenotrophica (strain DSM 10507 / JCM 14656 / S5a33) TaxID=476272 RepID=C0CPT0_BLAHS|nr:hypothetical protein RUMHYD_02881 [Blautia hydrogenotrophica DSM 10507]
MRKKCVECCKMEKLQVLCESILLQHFICIRNLFQFLIDGKQKL